MPLRAYLRRFVCAFRLRTYGVQSVNPALHHAHGLTRPPCHRARVCCGCELRRSRLVVNTKHRSLSLLMYYIIDSILVSD